MIIQVTAIGPRGSGKTYNLDLIEKFIYETFGVSCASSSSNIISENRVYEIARPPTTGPVTDAN